MRRKDMVPGTIYCILNNSMPRPGVVLDSSTERVRVRVWWTWPSTEEGAETPGYNETDYLDPHPPITDPRAKYDDKIVKTSDVIAEWEPWAIEAKAERAERLQARLDAEQAEKDAVAAERASDRHRLSNVSHLIEGHDGYLSIDHLAGDLIHARTQSRYSAKDVLELLEHVAGRTVPS
jgi:hypothetical protein